MGKTNTFWKAVSQNYGVVSDAENGTNKMTKYVCNYCMRRYAFNVTRMAAHLFMDCEQCPQNVKDTLRSYKKIDIFKNYSNKGMKMKSKSIKSLRWVHVARHFRKIFSENTETGKLDTYVCNYCNEQYPCNIKEMAEHISVCNLCPDETKLSCYADPLESMESMESFPGTSQMNDPEINVQDNSIFLETNHYQNINNSNDNTSNSSFHIDKIKINYSDTEDNITEENNYCSETSNIVSNEEHESWSLLAKACYATGVSIKILHNKHWQNALKALKPDIRLPPEQLFFQDYLNDEYDTIQQKVEDKIKEAKSLGLQIHGLHNKHNSAILIMFTTPEPVVYKIVDVKTLNQNPNYLSDLIGKILNEVGNNRILSVVTDKLSWKTLQPKFPISPVFYACNLQIFKLLISDIFNSFRSTLLTCYAIVEEVKNCPMTASVFFARKDGTELLFPSKKYYEKTKTSLDNLLKNKHILQTLVEKGYIRKSNSRMNILDEISFWPSILLLNSLLKYLDEWVKQIKSSASLSLIVECYRDLENKFKETFANFNVSKEQSTEILNCLTNYKQYAIQDINKAASLLDPYFMGKNMPDEDIIDAVAFINNLSKMLPDVQSEKIMFDIAAYRSKQGIWSKQFVWNSLQSSNKLPPVIWWQSMCASTEISKIAVAILSCSPILVNVGKISSFNEKSSNSERARKLIYVKHNLNLLDKNSLDDCSSDEDSDSDSENELAKNEILS